MAIKLTTPITLGKVADEYEFLGVHIDLVENKVTIHYAYQDHGTVLERKTVTGSFSAAGLVTSDLSALRNRIVSWLKSRGDIN